MLILYIYVFTFSNMQMNLMVVFHTLQFQKHTEVLFELSEKMDVFESHLL